ncbi:MAG: RNA polymerase-binding protein DksA [Proteobacteria bacterium]|nr:RNA polymerase-binding protein DksA [Pseudomonadota bacterium]
MAAKKPVKAKKPAAKKPEAKKAAKPVAPKAKAAPAKPVAKPKAAAKPVPKVAAKPAAKAPAKPVPAKPAPVAKAPAPAPAKPVIARPAPARLEPARPLPPRTLVRLGEGEEDGADGGNLSLLAGPRNVKPYLAKKGEQYMSKEQLEHFRTILLTWKRDLMEEVDRTVTHMKDEAANPPDPNDRATLESEFSLELRTRDRERKLIRKIDEALARIEDGSYGYCLETGEEIGIKRLEARPVATLSIEAQERRERREKQYGDRDDRYR